MSVMIALYVFIAHTAQINGGGNFGKFGELHIIHKCFHQPNYVSLFFARLPDKKFALKFTQLYIHA